MNGKVLNGSNYLKSAKAINLYCWSLLTDVMILRT